MLTLQHLAVGDDNKKKFGYKLPGPVVAAFEAVAGRRLGGKEKWVAMSAAILLLVEASQDEQDDAIARVQAAAAVNGSFDALMAAARRTSLERSVSLKDPRRKNDAAAGRAAGRSGQPQR